MDLREEVIEYAKRFIGVAYVYSGNNPLTGMDCSGLVCECLRAFGLIGFREDLTAQSLSERFKKLPPSINRGCLLFFGASWSSVSHVAISLGDGIMIEAGGGDSTTTNVSLAAKRNAFVRIRRIASRGDLLGGLNIFV